MGLAVPTISVADVGYSTSGGRGDKDLTIDILLDPAVAGAAVHAEVTRDGAVILTDTPATDSTGTASIFIRNHRPGCYTTSVTGIDGTGRVFDGTTPENQYGCDPPTTTTTSSTTTTTTSSTTTTSTTTTTTAPGSVAVTAIEPNTMVSGGSLSATITGSGFTEGVAVSFSGGEGPAPEAVATFVSDGEISVGIVTKDGGPPRDRLWDVTVANPDGSSGTLLDGLRVDATP
jgi:hypothetical protein